MSKIEDFQSYREKMNQKILNANHKGITRFFNLDTAAYREGALPAKTKELLALVASTVLRCNHCIAYHIIQCKTQGVTKEEFYDAFNVALIVGGSITIPHIRYAFELLDELFE
ncbi:MAG: carboxymuconolactone decarboxylase family protein [Theionarchaea archaeon]|nr:MAG: alkylhydroperoxidase [Theionarchaea archaeon DG-70]MBU7012201.1 carboxymuconolactone decarboxylase family protein [Theionarchaea archaeon]